MLSLAKTTILSLLHYGVDAATAAEAETDILLHKAKSLAASSYLNAANAVLDGHVALHDDLICHPNFLTLRAFQRKTPY